MWEEVFGPPLNNQNVIVMKRTHQSKSGDTWEWEETPEVIKALKAYWDTVKKNGKL